MITIKRIEELAKHRLVPAWAIKLVQDCVEDEAQNYPNLNCKSVQKRLATSWGYVKAQPQDHSEQHLNMVQGEWVDLTDDEVEELATDWFAEEWAVDKAKGLIDDFLAKFKERNTPPVVPQGEPVAWMVYTTDGQSVYVTDNPTDIKEGQRALPLYTTPPVVPQVVTEGNASEVRSTDTGEPVGYLVYSLDGISFEDSYCEGAEPVYTTPPVVPQGEPVKLTQEMMGVMIEEGYGVSTNDWGEHLSFAEEILRRYTTPPSVEAAICTQRELDLALKIAVDCATKITKENAAKICEKLAQPISTTGMMSDFQWSATSCAAAIRNMK